MSAFCTPANLAVERGDSHRRTAITTCDLFMRVQQLGICRSTIIPTQLNCRLRTLSPLLVGTFERHSIYSENPILRCLNGYNRQSSTGSNLGLPNVYANCYRATIHRMLASAIIFTWAHGNFTKYLDGETVGRKRYFYVLRPVLACQWIERQLGPVPMEFTTLYERIVQDDDLKAAISNLLKEKAAGNRTRQGPADCKPSTIFLSQSWLVSQKNTRGSRSRNDRH